jgi:RNA polymerase sigma factor (sigma-70 family)
MDDWQLLNQYAAEKSDDAFRTLVDRYAGLVYHTALRQTGNTHSAEEVAQNVFIALAQKAGTIRKRPSLCGWLFRATRIAVLNEARRNSDRERHKEEVLAMHPAAATTESDSLWESLAPHLDDVLEKLSEQDRELVMVRFFANKTHKELSDALGVSEQAARKRLSRALERLRVIFARRGIVMSSLALAAVFSTHGAKAAPLELASSCSKVALAKAAVGAVTATTGGSLSLLPTIKMPFVLAVLSGIIVIGTALLLVPKSHSVPPLDSKPATNPAASQAAFDATQSSSNPALAQPAANPATDSNSFAALDRIKAALNDPNPTTNFPNSVMQEAIAQLGTNKIAAIPILQGALTNSDGQVRFRAIDGLGIVGPEAKESAPLLLEMLRTGGADGGTSNGWT